MSSHMFHYVFELLFFSNNVPIVKLFRLLIQLILLPLKWFIKWPAILLTWTNKFISKSAKWLAVNISIDAWLIQIFICTVYPSVSQEWFWNILAMMFHVMLTFLVHCTSLAWWMFRSMFHPLLRPLWSTLSPLMLSPHSVFYFIRLYTNLLSKFNFILYDFFDVWSTVDDV